MTQIIYVVASNSQSIEVWKISDTGNMSLMQIVNTDDGQGQPITILKKRNKLYIGIKPKCAILVYDILWDGTLKKIGSLITPYSPNYLSCDKKEKFLFCSYYHANCISVHKLNENHTPNPPMQIINNIKGCHFTKFDLSYELVFTSALLEDHIYLYKFNESNIKSPLTEIKHFQCNKKSGPRHIDFHINKKYAYSINEMNGTVDVWKINHIKKNIQNIQNIHLYENNELKKYWCSDIHLTTCGKYLYAADRQNSKITAFQVHSNNKLSIIDQYHTCNQPRSFCIDKNNQYLIAAGELSNTIMVHTISSEDGSLNQLKEYKVGKNPIWVLAHNI
ncbi:beta-propeller fold lactonase family protein [Buchnera aphidicola]|uniref:beta-propeller fold lactonase family protein n=1 Tax=Buchnera aphidicola TaxID=9 RepID=UPI0034644D07